MESKEGKAEEWKTRKEMKARERKRMINQQNIGNKSRRLTNFLSQRRREIGGGKVENWDGKERSGKVKRKKSEMKRKKREYAGQ